MAGTTQSTAFSILAAELAAVPNTPGTTPAWERIWSTNKANYKLDVSKVDQWGDNVKQQTFYHSQMGTLSLTTNKITMAIIERLTGNIATSSAAGEEDIYFGTDKELDPPSVMVRLTIPIRRKDRSRGKMYVYILNATPRTLWDSVPGNEHAKLMEMNIEFDSNASYQTLTGDPLPSDIEHAFGLISMR